MHDDTDALTAQLDSLIPPPLPLSRRGFLQPVMAQTAITTDSEGLTAGEIQVPTADGNMPAYRAQPAQGGPFPVILVVQEIFGVHEYIKDTCRRLAKLGYQAIAPELYARQGDPRQYSYIQELIAKVVNKVPDSQVMADLDACAAWAKDHDGDAARLGVTGFCWGGRIVWLYAAHNPGVKAGVAWYGRLSGASSGLTPKHPLDLADQLNGPVLGLYGGQDPGIPPDTVKKMQAALAESANPASKASSIHVYPDAPHAFHADYRASYRKEAAEDGWKRMHAWFRQHSGPCRL